MRSSRGAQAGAASLIVVLMLVLTLLLAAGYAGRSVLYEQMSSAHQYRATQALQAADAGADWAIAQLNGGKIDDDCQPADTLAARPLRERSLRLLDADSGAIDPREDPSRSGTPACVHDDAGAWHCRCPSRGQQMPPAASADRPAPAFVVRLAGAPSPGSSAPGLVQVTASGCAQAVAPDACGTRSGRHNAFATVSVQAALVPALASTPAAVLTASGEVDAGTAAVGLHNTDPAGSAVVVDAGLEARLPSARIGVPPGAPVEAAVIDNDQALHDRSAEQLSSIYLGLAPPAFRALPSVATLDCRPDCTASALAALASGRQMMWTPGDLVLADAVLGSTAEPVLLVADGEIRLSGSVRLTGFVFGRSLQWQGAAAGQGLLRGSAVIAGDVHLDGSPDLVYDAEALRALRVRVGTYVKVPGSWSDTR